MSQIDRTSGTPDGTGRYTAHRTGSIPTAAGFIRRIHNLTISKVDEYLANGHHVLLYTSRELVFTEDPEENLAIGKQFLNHW